MSSWHSYCSIYNLGHSAIATLLKSPVQVEEKVDGSQFSFGIFPTTIDDIAKELHPEDVPDLELKVRSKGAVMHPDAPEKMFTKAVNSVKGRLNDLKPGWTYRAEYLAKPGHGALIYDRIPNGHLIIFDINPSEEAYLSYDEKRAEAERLGFECVPLLFSGMLETIQDFRKFLDTTSVLGGQKIEGVVIKPVGYDLFGKDKKVLMGKFVSEAFREVHSKAWKEANPTGKDILATLGDVYGTQARWQKSIQHLREAGQIEDDVRDIGKIMQEIPEDVKRECEDQIKEQLFAWAWPHIRRMTARGFPAFYKELLLKKQFEGEE